MTALLEARAVRKVFAGGDGQPLEVLRAVDLEVHRASSSPSSARPGRKEHAAASARRLDRPTGGDVWLDGSRYADLDGTPRRAANRKLGFVFQFHHLLREFTALENVMMPLLIGEWATPGSFARRGAALLVGLADE